MNGYTIEIQQGLLNHTCQERVPDDFGINYFKYSFKKTQSKCLDTNLIFFEIYILVLEPFSWVQVFKQFPNL